MRSYVTRYEPVTAKATRRGKCPGCDKSVVRSRTFSMTVSPFNKNPDGTVRTYAQVAAAVRVKADAWAPLPELFWHDACMDSAA